MAPPEFKDLGKATRDIFENSYILDMFKLIARNNTCGSLTMKTGVEHKFEDGKFTGNVEGSYPYPRHGLTFTKKWNTDNVIGLAAELADKIYPGVILKAEGTFAPDTGVKTGITSVAYKHENVHAKFQVDGGTGSEPEDNLKLNPSVVVGYEGWLTGASLEYDNNDGNVKNHWIGLGHSYGNIQAFLIAQNFSLFTAHYYQRVNNRVEMGVMFGADTGEEKKQFYNLGARYLLTEDTSIRAKVDNESMVGFSFESTLQGCVKVILSWLIDGKKLNEGGHKYGIGVDIM